MKRATFLLIIIFLALPSSLRGVGAQRYIIAINFRVTFNQDGTAVVTLLQHPFNISRKGFEDLYGDPAVLENMMMEEELVAASLTLLFSDNPEKVDYEIIGGMRMEDEEVVLCDVENVGEMKELKGAVVLDVLIRLESTDSIEQIADKVYRIKVTDCFTRRNPMSWIDVIEFRMGEGVEILSYEWNPKTAKGPKVVEKDRLLWENFNEPEAPNEYILEVKLPAFKLERAKEYKISAVYSISNGLLTVSLKNVGREGFFFVRAIGEGVDQVRKVYLKSWESANLTFPAPKEAKVEIWHEKTLIAEAKQMEREVEEGIKLPSMKVYMLMISGIVLIFLSFLVEERKESEEELGWA